VLAPVRATALSLAVAFACVALSGCTGSPVDYAGRVVGDSVTLQVTALTMPSVDLDAGITPGAAGASAGNVGTKRSNMATAVAITGLGSVVRVASVAVAPGDEVVAGQEIARLDSAALDANVLVAQAAFATGKAQVGVLDDALDTVASSRWTLARRRAQVVVAEAHLLSMRGKLANQLAEAKAMLARIEAFGARGGMPGVPPTGTVPPAGPLPDPARLRTGIVELTAALARIDVGLAQVASGHAKLFSAEARLRDARSQLKNVRALSQVAVGAAEVGVRLAKYQRQLAMLRSPADGVVVRVARVGDVLAPGATVAEIRRDGPPRVTTWLAPEQLAGVAVGTEVEVSADWFPRGLGSSGDIGATGGSRDVAGSRGRVQPIPGRVTSVGTRAEYPPTSFATSEIHLTRAIRVEMTLSPSAEQPALPPGTPVDVRFLGK